MQSVIVGAPPVGRCVVAVGGKERDAAAVVVGAAQRVLDLTGEILAGFTAKRKLQRVAFQISLGLHLPHLSQSMICTHVVPAGQNGGVAIDRAKNIYTTCTDVDGAERALGGDLALRAAAELQSIRNTRGGTEGPPPPWNCFN